MLFLAKYNWIFGVGYCDRKNIFPFMDVLPLIYFQKNPEEKYLLKNWQNFYL